MLLSRLYLLTLLLTACANPGRPDPQPVGSELEQLAAGYSHWVDSHRDSSGFILVDGCDSTLFSGLLGAALPGTVNLTASRDSETGQWYRRPLDYTKCHPSEGNSRSSFSRDMLVGTLWWIWRNQRLDVATDLLDYLRDHGYSLGAIPSDGTPGELLVNPNQLYLLARIVERLGGGRQDESLLPTYYSTSGTGFERHLAVWQVLLAGELDGELSRDELAVLTTHRDSEPRNPLYQAAYARWVTGDFSTAEALLLTQFPSERLPNSGTDWCSDWVIQRDYSPRDWHPCSGGVGEHTGAELVVIYNLVIR